MKDFKNFLHIAFLATLLLIVMFGIAVGGLLLFYSIHVLLGVAWIFFSIGCLVAALEVYG